MKPGNGIWARKSSDESFACQGIDVSNEGGGEVVDSPTSVYRSGLPPSLYGEVGGRGEWNEGKEHRVDSDISFWCEGPFTRDVDADLYSSSPPLPSPRQKAGPSSPQRTRTTHAPGPPRAEPEKLKYEFIDSSDEAEYLPRPFVVRKPANSVAGNLAPVTEVEVASPPGVKRPPPRDTRFYEPYRRILEEYERG
jgi:hypothetical protein